MTSPCRVPGYAGAMQAMHWATVALLIGAYVAVWSIKDGASDATTAGLAMLHRSFGLTILGLTAFRFAWRQRTPVPQLPADVPRFQRIAARASVAALYVLLGLQPVLGVVGSLLYGDRVTVFGAVVLPSLLPFNRPLARQTFWLHGWTALLLLALISMHVGAALYHHFVRRDAVLSGMLPGVRPLPARDRLAQAPR